MDPMTIMAIASMASSAAPGIMGLFSKDKSPGADSLLLDYPDLYEDPLFRSNVEPVSNLSLGLLKGDVPDYYKPIGEIGGKTFEDMLGSLTKDVTKGVEESMSAGNTARGGLLGTTVASKVGDLSSQLRYNDLLRALEGRQNLLTTGLQGAEFAGTSGLNFSNLANDFNLNIAGLKLKDIMIQNELLSAEEEGKSNFFGGLANTALSVGNLFKK